MTPEERMLDKTWFYRFRLPDGRMTASYDNGALDAIHDTRQRMIDSVLDAQYGGNLAGKSVLDVACHQGWFAANMAQRGADRVLAVDPRAEHVADARLACATLGLSQVEVAQDDVHLLNPRERGTFDVVLMLGLIYHLENPVGALRQARAMTREVCIVETQVVPGMSGMVDYGSYRFVRPLKGSFGIIDETEETHGPEASTTGICLVPSVEALLWIMRKVGFTSTEVVAVPDDGYEQLRHGKRVMAVGRVD